MQVMVDARIEAIAGAGGRQRKRRSKLDRQPTPRSIAAAEDRLGDGDGWSRPSRRLRARARRTVPATRACEQALAQAQRAIGP